MLVQFELWLLFSVLVDAVLSWWLRSCPGGYGSAPVDLLVTVGSASIPVILVLPGWIWFRPSGCAPARADALLSGWMRAAASV